MYLDAHNKGGLTSLRSAPCARTWVKISPQHSARLMVRMGYIVHYTFSVYTLLFNVVYLTIHSVIPQLTDAPTFLARCSAFRGWILAIWTASVPNPHTFWAWATYYIMVVLIRFHIFPSPDCLVTCSRSSDEAVKISSFASTSGPFSFWRKQLS